ncbi:MAG: hypothetical protein U0T33_06735 [Bacteroidales bacterium]
MKTGNFLILALIISASLIGGCTPKAKYERMLKRELARGVRCDSLFMGLYLGMPQKDFYSKCWELNKTGLIKQGEGNMTVEYKMKNELKHQAFMNFYPKFEGGKISEMPVKYKYAGWAPWNKALSSDKLQLDVLSYYEKLYGKGFITVSNKVMGNAYVKIDGNRRITIYKADDLYVYATFTDLTVKNDTISSNRPDSIKTSVSNSEKKANE